MVALVVRSQTAEYRSAAMIRLACQVEPASDPAFLSRFVTRSANEKNGGSFGLQHFLRGARNAAAEYWTTVFRGIPERAIVTNSRQLHSAAISPATTL